MRPAAAAKTRATINRRRGLNRQQLTHGVVPATAAPAGTSGGAADAAQHCTAQPRGMQTPTTASHLFDVGVVEVHPLAYLGLEEEGGVVLAVVAHHAHQVELRLASPLLCHAVEQLQGEREGERGGGRRDAGKRGREGREIEIRGS